jgi:hypothetical protein
VGALLAAGCGGSSASKRTVATARKPPPPPARTTGPRTSTPTASTAGPPPRTTTGASNVLLPATFTVHSGGVVTPPSVAAPAGVIVELTLVSADHEAHRAEVAGRVLSVPAGGSASARLRGLAKGNYPLVIDGVRRGTLVIGAQPGP